MASATVVDEYRFHSPVVRSILRQTRSPLRSGKVPVEVGECRKREIHLLCASARESDFCRGKIKSNSLRPNFVLAAADGRKDVSASLVRIYSSGESLAGVPGG